MDKEKKKWETPKVICLYRGRPEEAVLGNCKISSEAGPSGSNCAATGGAKCKTGTMS